MFDGPNIADPDLGLPESDRWLHDGRPEVECSAAAAARARASRRQLLARPEQKDCSRDGKHVSLETKEFRDESRPRWLPGARRFLAVRH